MTASFIIGCDPGASGALAWLDADTGGLVVVEDMPHHDGVVSGALIADMVRRHSGIATTVAWIELVGAMPKQGVSSTFKFGRSYGAIAGALEALRIPTNYVTPAKWKSAAGLGKDKGQSRRRAIELWPAHSHMFARVKDDGRAEACLIARHGFLITNNQPKEPQQ